MPVTPPRLVTPNGQPAVGQTLELPADGLTLTLKVPEVSPAHLELTQAELTLAAPTGTVNLTGGDAGLTVTTNLGPLSANWTSEKDAAKGVTWLVADWGVRRPLLALSVSTTAPSDPANKARLRVSDGGVWFPPQSVETLPFNEERALPDLVASRVMLEVVKAGPSGVLEPAKGYLSGLTLKLGAQPEALSVGVGTEPPVLEHPGRLVTGQQVRVVDGLREALQRAVPSDGKAADIPVVLRDAMRGQVRIADARFVARTVHTVLDGGGTSLPFTGGG